MLFRVALPLTAALILCPSVRATDPLDLGGKFDCECPEGQSPSDQGCVENPLRNKYVQPKYPESARVQGREARLVFRVLLHKNGSFGEIALVKSTTTDARFEANAVQAMRKWRYKPATLRGEPVDVYFHVVIDYDLKSSSSLPKLEAVGKAIFEQDRAAWLATDRLVESNGGLPNDVRGWVTLPSDKGWCVFFVQEKGDGYCSMLNVLVNENGAGSLRRSDTCEPLTSDQRAMFLARQTALSALRTSCSEAYNTVVLPHEGTEATWAVYLLAATQEAGKVVVGGHVRVLVRDGGLDVVDYQQLSKACLTLDAPSSNAGKPVALVVTHLLDDHPIETHVFLSLLHELTLYVMTESAMWSVDKGKIRLLMDGEDFKAYLEKAKVAHDKEKGESNN